MTAPECFRVGDDQLWCHPWHQGARTVVLSPRFTARAVKRSSVARVVEELGSRGVRRVLTAALDERSAEPFIQAGFGHQDRLRVFRHDLSDVSPTLRPRPVTAHRRRDVRRSAAVDGLAFDDQARLDEGGLIATLDATPRSRLRIVGARRGALEGYLVSGLVGNVGYLQRLAVDPRRQRQGLATALVSDALRWLNRHGAQNALVNTTIDNAAAQRLYRRLGFVETSEALSVYSQHCEPR